MTLDDMMLGRFPPMTVEDLAAMQRYYAGVQATVEAQWPTATPEEILQDIARALDIDIGVPEGTHARHLSRD